MGEQGDPKPQLRLSPACPASVPRNLPRTSEQAAGDRRALPTRLQEAHCPPGCRRHTAHLAAGHCPPGCRGDTAHPAAGGHCPPSCRRHTAHLAAGHCPPGCRGDTAHPAAGGTLPTRLQEDTLSGLTEVGAGAACLRGEDGAPCLTGCSPVPEMGSDSSGTAAHERGPTHAQGPAMLTSGTACSGASAAPAAPSSSPPGSPSVQRTFNSRVSKVLSQANPCRRAVTGVGRRS